MNSGFWRSKPTLSNELKNFVAQSNLPPTSAKVKAHKKMAELPVKLLEMAYDARAKTLDDAHLHPLTAEIDSAMKEEPGVLVARYTARHPDSAGNMRPEYLGLAVVGTGYTEGEARLKYERAEQEHAQATSGPSVCTPENPTGEAPKSRPQLRAAPAGRNFGYSAQLAAKMAQILQKNPRNKRGGLVLHHANIERNLFFISKTDWERRKNDRKYGPGGAGSASSGAAPGSAPAASSSSPVSIVRP